ncbi:uncharacterized protein V1518DRAFT_416066 [Limtongia smithiae]|uniref:uncharacterized protein n=1 Tax=Limtongia smithiae TaxID=1125753 RepID=UPI0034CE6740
MAASTEAIEAPASAVVPDAAADGTPKPRPVKPDQAAFDASLAVLEKDLKTKSEKHEYLNSQWKLLSHDSPSNEKQQELRSKLNAVRARQQEIRGGSQKIIEEIKSLEDANKRRVKEIQSAKSKLSFKSLDELDSHIKKLEAQVETGSMRLVDERRVLSDIQGLKKGRKNFASISEAEQLISETKEKIAALRSTIDDTESKELSAQHKQITTELDALRAETDVLKKNKSQLYEQRETAHKSREEAYQALRKLKDDFNKQRREYGKYEQEERQKRWERKQAERDAEQREKRKKRAEQRLAEASQPAFEADIERAEVLLRYFDPSVKATTTSLTTPSGLAAQATRTIDSTLPAGAQVLERKPDEDYFVGGKKGKKKAGKVQPKEEKFLLSFDIVQTLTDLKIGVPVKKEEVPATIASLTEKIEWFISNQEKQTEENIKKATADIERLEKQAEAEESAARVREPRQRQDRRRNGKPATPIENGTTTPADITTESPADETAAAAETEADGEAAVDVAPEEAATAEE